MIRFLSISLLALLAIQCSGPVKTPEKPVISVSILPQAWFLEELAGELAEINVMVPSGASPATYEPDMQQMVKLEHSILYFRIGHIGFEKAWMSKISELYPDLKVIDLSANLNLIRQDAHDGTEDAHAHADHHHSHHGWDPHTWMSVRNGRIIARDMAQALEALFPGERESIRENLGRLDSTLAALDLQLGTMLGPARNSSFMIYHPALAYFARDYGLKQYALESGGQAPSVAHMRHMVDLGRSLNIRVVLIQSQFDRSNAEGLAGSLEARVVQIDPLDPALPEQLILIARELQSAEP